MAIDLSVLGRMKTKADFDREEEEFQIRKMVAQKATMGQDPAAIKLANEIAKARAGGDIQRLNDLYMSAKLMDRGIITDANGNPIAMQGYGDAVGSIAGAKASYEQNAKNVSDLGYKPMIARDVARQEAGVKMATEPAIQAATNAAKIRSESIATAQNDLPKYEAQAQDMLKVLSDIESAPGLSASVGMPNPLKGRIPFIGDVAGSPAADFTAKLEQLGGKQFLEAFQSLKGGGQITEVEGTKATNAIARMQTSQSEREFLNGLNEFKLIVSGALDRMREKANQQPNIYGPDNPVDDPLTVSRNAIQKFNAENGANPYGTVPQAPMDLPANVAGGNSSLDQEETIFNAKKAIRAGANAELVKKRLIENGIDPKKAGL